MGWIFLIAAVLILLAVLFLWWQDNHLTVYKTSLSFATLPDAFSGERIVHLSDLHNKSFGIDQKRLIDAVSSCNPDRIVITGDLIDKRRTTAATFSPALTLIKALCAIAPVYYCPGNHEAESGLYPTLLPLLLKRGVTVLNDSSEVIEKNGEQIAICGVMDVRVSPDRFGDGQGTEIHAQIMQSVVDMAHAPFRILLSHRPHLAKMYAQSGASLVFCGHAHGGQIRLPFVGGLFAPDQGIFPRYTAGVYQAGNATVVISRGLGNSKFPFRVFNRPQIVCVTIKTDET